MPYMRKRRFGPREYLRLAQMGGRAFQAGRAVWRNKRARTGTFSRKNKMTSGRGFTFENDKSRIYNRRKAPRRARKRWTRAIRKNNALDQIKLGTRTVVFNNRDKVFENTSPTAHGLGWLGLYGAEGNTEVDDLKRMAGYENITLGPGRVDGGSVFPSTKIFFKSAVLDMTIRNTSGNPTTGALADIPLEVDIYEITSGKQWVETESGTTLVKYANIKDAFSDSNIDMFKLKNAPQKTDLSLRGCTPWDVTYALSNWRMKIHKKTKYRIGSGQTITYQIRDPKNRTTSAQRMLESTGANKPGWTRHVLLIFKAIPGIVISASQAEQLTVGVTRKYSYKIEGETDDRSGYIIQ